MGNHIVEYIGHNKLVHTELDHSRAEHPHPGDVIDFGENEGIYPYTHGKYGRVDSLNHFGTGMIGIICEPGSAFLGENYVTISGGPFDTISPDELEPTYKLYTMRFWNWGNNLPGAGKGVDYYIARPVFRLKPRTDEAKNKVNAAFQS